MDQIFRSEDPIVGESCVKPSSYIYLLQQFSASPLTRSKTRSQRSSAISKQRWKSEIKLSGVTVSGSSDLPPWLESVSVSFMLYS